MTEPRMHADEVAADADLVRRLLGDQFQHWAELPIIRVPSSGTDHAIYRLGERLAVRMPRVAWATGQAALERTWLPQLAEHLPVQVPEHVGSGAPAHDYPFEWSVVTWLPGLPADVGDRTSDALVDDLAEFVHSLRAFDGLGLPVKGPAQRGGILAAHDTAVRQAIIELGDRIDATAALHVWAEALEAAPPEDRVKTHGDLLPGNLLLEHGRLTAVIDWGGLAVADPAIDLLPAWSAFDSGRRERLRSTLVVDEDTWARGRGWALQQAMLALPYYWDTNPGMVRQASYAISQVSSG
jgi:aminoglycoside phosphotransferase (APT) family kinase protein